MKTALRILCLVAVARTTAVFALPAEYVRIRESDFDRGYVPVRTASEDVHDFSVSGREGVQFPTRLVLRGGSADYVRISMTNLFPGLRFPLAAARYRDVVAMVDGTLVFEDGTELPSRLGTLGILPRSEWGELPASCTTATRGAVDAVLGEEPAEGAASTMWWAPGAGGGSLVITWENALLDRDVDIPVSYQVELFSNGSFTFHFDLSRVPAGHPVLGRMWLAFGTERPTTVEFHGLAAEDRVDSGRDGDGLDTERELFDYRTNPWSNDTDGDSLYDLAEMLRGTSPRVWDTDGDGYGDATDPDPRNPTSWDDTDNDGLPEAWVAGWFGGVAPDPYADAGGDGISNIASLHMGVRPDTSWALGTQAYQGLLTANSRAYKFVPAAFEAQGLHGDAELYVVATNWVDRTFSVARVSPWQQLFLTSDLASFAGWESAGMSLRWEAGGESGDIPASSIGPYRIPVSHANTFLEVRLTMHVDHLSPGTPRPPVLSSPLFLVVWTPRLELSPYEFAQRASLSGSPAYLVGNRPSWGPPEDYLLPCVVSRDGDPFRVFYGDDAVHDPGMEEALTLPIVPGAEFGTGGYWDVESSYIRWHEDGVSVLPRQGVQPGIYVIRYYMPWYW